MGGGTWTKDAYRSYVTTAYNVSTSDLSLDGSISSTCNLSNQDIFKSKRMVEALNPKNVMRECLDSEEHPNTIPVILALDVTGSMGQAAVETAKKLNTIMTSIYSKVPDVEFMIMGIGDLAYDNSPIQASQFESDIRIAEQLDKVYFEFGGGGNNFESYTAAWYFGLYHTKLDCYDKRGKKGIIITMGDERMNPYLPHDAINRCLGDTTQAEIETKDLYREASKKFDIYHIDVEHGYRWDDGIVDSWNILGDNFKCANMNDLSDVITSIIIGNTHTESCNTKTTTNENGEIVW